ncbi:hypothetical protein NC651_014244 [Populus alba x Populus x berolinensis]|nr:hypothetical protein NC651_014244 [Populus alba x Populus x berolinensis]
MFSGLIHRINGSAGSENGRPASSSHQGSKTRTKITKRGKQLVKGRKLSVNKRRKKISQLIIQEPATRLNYDSDRTFNDIHCCC